MTSKIRRVIKEQMQEIIASTGVEFQRPLERSFAAPLSSVLHWRNDLRWTAKGTKYCQMIREVNME